MSNEEKVCLSSILTKGKSASQNTSLIKQFGGGSMENGIDKFSAHFLNKGRLQGVLGCVSIFSLCVATYCIYKYEKNNKKKNAVVCSENLLIDAQEIETKESLKEDSLNKITRENIK